MNIALAYTLISTDEDKMDVQKAIKILNDSMLTFGARRSDLPVTMHFDLDLLLLYLATFTNIETVHKTAEILGINL